MSSTEVMTEHDTQSPAAATVDAKLGCHPERSEGSACRLKAAPASRVPARRYAPRDDTFASSAACPLVNGRVHVEQLMLVWKRSFRRRLPKFHEDLLSGGSRNGLDNGICVAHICTRLATASTVWIDHVVHQSANWRLPRWN